MFRTVARGNLVFRIRDEIHRVGGEKHRDRRNVVGLKPTDFHRDSWRANFPGLLGSSGLGWAAGRFPQ